SGSVSQRSGSVSHCSGSVSQRWRPSQRYGGRRSACVLRFRCSFDQFQRECGAPQSILWTRLEPTRESGSRSSNDRMEVVMKYAVAIALAMLSAAALAKASQRTPVVCLHGADESADQKTRRQQALQLTRAI